MADPNIASIKSSLLKAISDQLDKIERESSDARAANRDLYSRTGPGDLYSRNTLLKALDASFE